MLVDAVDDRPVGYGRDLSVDRLKQDPGNRGSAAVQSDVDAGRCTGAKNCSCRMAQGCSFTGLHGYRTHCDSGCRIEPIAVGDRLSSNGWIRGADDRDGRPWYDIA